MTATTGAGDDRTATEWLASAALDPEACLRAWESDPLGVVLLPAGRVWDVLVLGGELGRLTLEVLYGVLDRPGPVLADADESRIGFLVPPGTAAHWIGTGVRGAGNGTWIVVPRPDVTSGSVHWLVPPDSSGTLSDPVLLELAMHEAAVRLSARSRERDAAPPAEATGGMTERGAGETERGGVEEG
ncbi:hypothetical protein [Streptomyces sp. NPDC007088]|uniref:hypothetical protein n=1 Tax=Streptomyces sp. NPDC007088 TaxID=3364773 RepID=UPI0036CAF4A4